MDPGETYMDGLINEQNLAPADDASHSSGVGEVQDDDDGQYSTISAAEEEEPCIYYRPGDRLGGETPPDGDSDAPNIGIEIVGMPSENENSAPSAVGEQNVVDLDDKPVPAGKSIAHHFYKEGKAVLCSFDLEHIGDHGGIVQISAVLGRVKMHDDGTTSVDRQETTFNKYVKPPENAIWNESACGSHGLHANMPCIQSADDINTVWSQFCDYIKTNVNQSDTVILVAYNGHTCDMKWIWRLTQSPTAPCAMPPQIKFYIDPLYIMRKYKGCPFHKSRSFLESLELGAVWSYMKGGINLNGVHDSLIDAGAQMDIIGSDQFKRHLDMTESVRTIDSIFKKREQLEMKRKMEPIRKVHQPWVELKRLDNFSWEPSEEDQYTGSGGAGDYGPDDDIRSAASKQSFTLATLFLLLFPITLIQFIADRTKFYAYDDWVVETVQLDSDGNQKKRKMFKRCSKTTPGARKRAQREAQQFDITPGFVLAFIAILIIQGAKFGSNKRSRDMWREAPYGFSMPYISNSMKRDAFEFMRRYFKLSDDDGVQANRDSVKYHPLHKVKYVMDEMMKGIRNAWKAGREVCIDESMIKYMGRAVSFVQYMPKKPIKHGIKVFVAACARTAIILSYEVYLGADLTTLDSTAVAVVERILQDADLFKARGRVLYTDNWYTSVKLAKVMFDKYGWTICGTITPTDKISRQDEDVPFLKLSAGGLAECQRGWYREAYIEMKSTTGKKYCIQCTTWRDKKQVMFLHSHLVGSSTNATVRRHVKGKKQKVEIGAPTSQIDYVGNYNAVDRQDRDSADYTTSIKTVRYYIRIFCWMLDRVVHAIYVIVCHLTSEGNRPDWKKYSNKNEGRKNFQIDLGILLLNYAIELDMKDSNKKPKWMRQTPPIPCDCKKCYFCKNGITTGIAHPAKKAKVEIVTANNVRVKTSKCINERVRLAVGSNYCRMCYRSQFGAMKPDGSKKTSDEKKRDCNRSAMGCKICKEPICKDCWSKGYDIHQKKSIEC